MIVNKPQIQPINNDLFIKEVKEVSSNKELQLILKCATQWQKAATGKIKYFKEKNDECKMQIAKDAKYVAEDIIYVLTKDGKDEPTYSIKSINKNEKAVFAAYDNRGKLQGVAFVDLTKSLGYDNVLDEVLVNPERNSAIGKRAAIKGTGTKLVQAVANKVLMKKGEQNLGLLSLIAAIPFYIKLGFDDNGGGPGANNGPMTEDMSMNAKQMKMLCAKV